MHVPHPSTVTSSLTSSVTRVVSAPQAGQGGRGSSMAAMMRRRLPAPRTSDPVRGHGRHEVARWWAAVPCPSTARPATGHTLRRSPSGSLRALAFVVALVLSAGACTTGGPVTATGEALAKATPTPTPTVAVPTAPPEPQPLPQGPPVEVRVDGVQLASTSSDGIFGAAPAAVDPAVAGQWVTAASDRLRDFVNAMWVSTDTMLTDVAVATLLDPASLPPEARQGLGVLDRPDVLGITDVAAATTAQVQMDTTRLGTVTLFWSTSATLVLTGVSGPVTQTGVASFVERGAGPELVALEADTTFGGDLQAVLS